MKKMIAENKGKLVVSSLVILLPGLLGWRMAWEAVIFLAAHWLCLLLVFADRRNREGQSKKAIGLVFWLLPVISLLSGAVVAGLQRGYNGADFMIIVMNLGFGLLFLLIGNYMPKFRQNATIGIRVKWTLENEENWNVTHRFGGKVWVAAGLACMIAALLPSAAMAVVFTAAIVAAAIVPCVYSYLYYQKQLQAGTAVRIQSSPRQKVIGLVILVAVVAFVGWVLFAGSLEVNFGDTSFTVETGYWSDLTVDYDSIESVTYQPGDTAPSAGVRTYGFGNFRMLMGSFSNDAYGNYTRYTYASCKDSVVLSVHGETIVLNGPDTASTQALCEELTAQLAAR